MMFTERDFLDILPQSPDEGSAAVARLLRLIESIQVTVTQQPDGTLSAEPTALGLDVAMLLLTKVVYICADALEMEPRDLIQQIRDHLDAEWWDDFTATHPLEAPVFQDEPIADHPRAHRPPLDGGRLSDKPFGGDRAAE